MTPATVVLTVLAAASATLVSSSPASFNASGVKAAVEADVAALKAQRDDGPPPTGTQPPKLQLTPLAATEAAADAQDAKDALLAALTEPARVAAAAKAAGNVSAAVAVVKDALLDGALDAADFKVDVAHLPADVVEWAAGLKLNATDNPPSFVQELPGAAKATAVAALSQANGGTVPPGVAASYPDLAAWINDGAAIAAAGEFNFYDGVAAGAGRRLAQSPASTCAGVTLAAFPPPLRAGCPPGAGPAALRPPAGSFAGASPATAPLSQTLLMLFQAFWAYLAPARTALFWLCASPQGYVAPPVSVTGNVSGLVSTAEVNAIVLHTPTDIFVAAQGSDSAADFSVINIDMDPTDAASYFNAAGPLRVHNGFYRAHKVLWPGIAAAIQKIVAAPGFDAAGYRIYFTGHSLGAAIATLTALKFAALPPSEAAAFGADPASASPTPLAARVGGVYPFSGPRVGQASFRDTYNVLLGPVTRRVGYKMDLVTTQPAPLFGYRHVGAAAGVCPDASGLETVAARPVGADDATGCSNTDDGGRDDPAALGFNRHSPALLWDGLLRAGAQNGSGAAYGADTPALSCLTASLAGCPGTAVNCSTLLRCALWDGAPLQACQSCTRAATCGAASTAYTGRWTNAARRACPESLNPKKSLFPTVCTP